MDLRTEPGEFRQLDEERVLVLLHRRGRGKVSGLEVGERLSSSGAAVFHVRGGKVTRLAVYLDRERVLADLGLAPEDELFRLVATSGSVGIDDGAAACRF